VNRTFLASTWRRQCRAGELAASSPNCAAILNPLVLENRKLIAANAQLAKRLENAEFIIKVQK
jgi:hypothetical protein